MPPHYLHLAFMQIAILLSALSGKLVQVDFGKIMAEMGIYLILTMVAI